MRVGGRRPLGLGRRGMAMLIFAFIWCWIITNNVVIREPVVDDALFHTGWPVWLRLLEWYIPAIFAAVYAWRENDWPGYAALMIPPIIRIGSLWTGQVVYWLPGGDEGYATGAWDSILYIGMIGLLAVCAGWPDFPPRLTKILEEKKEDV